MSNEKSKQDLIFFDQSKREIPPCGRRPFPGRKPPVINRRV